MTRTERLLRLARLRGDRLAVATLETHMAYRALRTATLRAAVVLRQDWTEAELREAWGR